MVSGLGGELVAFAAADGADAITVCDLQSPQRAVKSLSVDGKLACTPIAYAGGLLVPTTVGHVFLLNPRTGTPLADPFQPRLEPGVELDWRLPAVAEDGSVLLADGRTKLYRLTIEQQPRPHLAASAEAEMAEPIVSPVAVLGNTAFAVNAADVLLLFQLPTLERMEAKEQTLAGRCVWGPQRVGDRVMLATAGDELLCLDDQGRPVWQVPLPFGSLAGTPLAAGDHFMMASRSGVVWRVDAADGRPGGKIETGIPLGTGPVARGANLLIGGTDGTLYLLDPPPVQ